MSQKGNKKLLSTYHAKNAFDRKNEGYVVEVSSYIISAQRLTSDRNAGEAKPCLYVKHVCNSMLWRKHDRIRDEPVLVALHRPDHRRLGRSGLVVVDDAYAAEQLAESQHRAEAGWTR